ncbi:hypothetical protein B6D60_11190 [candidate division KSB1 bacterium 4484_87]|nr:MAG: hypothetical protein B6D60_11190 [candidate division KSB1 bacterium 4484_87]
MAYQQWRRALKITPLDIKKQVFKKVLRGYDPIEVETFLEMVADEFEQLIRDKNTLSDDVLKLRTQLRDYQEVEKTFKESLMNAQQTMNQSRENSKREAALIIKEAEVKAEKIIETARKQLADMKNELMVIKAQKDSFAKRLRHLLESQIELLKVLEMDDVGFEKATAGGGQLDEKKKNNDDEEKSVEDLKISDQFIM